LAQSSKRQRLGELLLDSKELSEDQLRMALREQKRTGELLGETLVRLGFISRTRITECLALQSGTHRAALREVTLDRALTKVIPEKMAKQFRTIPIAREGNVLTVGMVDSFDVFSIDKLAATTGCELSVQAISEEDFIWGIDNLYGGLQAMETSIEDVIREAQELDMEEAEAAAEAPIVRLMNHLLIKAIREGATDLHLEPEEKVMRSRYRIDGVLHQGPSVPKELQPALISRVKIMSGMNISETRLPQDGRINFPYGSRQIDLRVSSFPTVFGEDLVLRLLDKERLALGLENLGFEADALRKFRELIQQPHGIVLVTGPTGSGKTTTLYSALLEINSLEKNVITLEDPVEYYLPLIRQSQINPKAGLTFAIGLRSILRQDPDVILVGEVRDLETAEMAIRSSLTGHLVFSTLHTNDSAGCISRLTEMGIEPFLINSTLLAAMAQRLVRINCPHCRESYEPDAAFRALFPAEQLEGITFYRGRGCAECNEVGFRGRMAVFEMLMMSPEIEDLVLQGKASNAIRAVARAQGMRTMREDGLLKVRRGLTTLEEVVRVTQA
jgi:type IV pilus assembly protein PilB